LRALTTAGASRDGARVVLADLLEFAVVVLGVVTLAKHAENAVEQVALCIAGRSRAVTDYFSYLLEYNVE